VNVRNGGKKSRKKKQRKKYVLKGKRKILEKRWEGKWAQIGQETRDTEHGGEYTTRKGAKGNT